MRNVDTKLVRGLVLEEIRRIVADKIEGQGWINTGRQAAMLARAYPNCGLSPEQIAGEIIAAAARAGVAVEISRPEMIEPERLA